MIKVLLIEDDPWLADSYAHSLTGRGYDVGVSASAAEAIDTIDRSRPNVVVADVILGDANVLALLHELQSYEDTSRIPVILCSSLPLEDFHNNGALSAYGVRDVLDKANLTPDGLVDAIELAYREARQ